MYSLYTFIFKLFNLVEYCAQIAVDATHALDESQIF